MERSTFNGLLGVAGATLLALVGSAHAVPLPVISYLLDDDTTPQFGSVTGTLQGSGGTQTSGPVFSSVVPLSYSGNKSLLFDGTDDRMGFGFQTVGQAINGASAVTLTSWIRFESGDLRGGQYDNIFFLSRVGLSNPGAGNLWANVRNDAGNVGKLLIGGRSQAGESFREATHPTVLAAGQWHLVAAIFDYANDQIRISIDGGALQTFSVNWNASAYVNEANPSTVVDTLSRSDGAANSFWKGYIDDVAVFNSALTQDDITFLYENGLVAIPEPTTLLSASLGIIGAWALSGRKSRG